MAGTLTAGTRGRATAPCYFPGNRERGMTAR
jgi:hypothetical protein